MAAIAIEGFVVGNVQPPEVAAKRTRRPPILECGDLAPLWYVATCRHNCGTAAGSSLDICFSPTRTAREGSRTTNLKCGYL